MSMITQKIRSLFEPSFDWIQVEVTSACNAACVYCPRTVYSDAWEDRRLSLEAFRNLEPAFAKTKHVHLQGWGEPFLHPGFFDMVAIAKAAGCRVGTTTNGMVLNRERIARVVEGGVDLIAFSLAGTGERNDLIRKGTSLKKVLDTIQTLDREKKEKGKTRPEIHIAYMLFRSAMGDLQRLPTLLEGLGVSQVVVSACVYTNLQVPEASYLWYGKKESYQRMVFGNIREEPLSVIWKKKAYADFRRSFDGSRLAAPCRSCPKLLGE